MKNKMFCSFLCLVFILTGCIKMKHDITIQPIHVIVEITVKVDKALNDFFGDIDKTSADKKDEKTATSVNEEGKK